MKQRRITEQDYIKANRKASREEELHKECSLGMFDQLHEAISIGRYFIARKDKKQLSYLINELYRTKDSSFNEAKWKSYFYKDKSEKYDTGLAHGMAGILYFLSKCYLLGVSTDLCKELIDGIFRFYKNNEQSYDTCKTFFPSSISPIDYKPSLQRNQECRLAWCYGDIGVLYSLFICGKSKYMTKNHRF